ncbi:hypothetical protein GCM10020000_34600 [Streptomyces olivoverticillatus]
MLMSASRLASSTMYTFIPPASPVPGWCSGEVWTLSIATLRGAAGRTEAQALGLGEGAERSAAAGAEPGCVLAHRACPPSAFRACTSCQLGATSRRQAPIPADRRFAKQ